jgi:hypothetical protein
MRDITEVLSGIIEQIKKQDGKDAINGVHVQLVGAGEAMKEWKVGIMQKQGTQWYHVVQEGDSNG